MKKNFIKAVCLVAALVCLLSFPVKATATSQGTDGTELEVVQPQQLQIQLGEAWCGVEFQLRTDAGKYPDPIPVGEDGILKLEIGGSDNYILTCLNSRVEIPESSDAVQADPSEETASEEETGALEETGETAATDTTETEVADPTEGTQAPTVGEEEEQAMIGNVPATHVIIFAGGLIIAVALLLFMHWNQKNKGQENADEDDEV